jgi:hypothetical protein
MRLHPFAIFASRKERASGLGAWLFGTSSISARCIGAGSSSKCQSTRYI